MPFPHRRRSTGALIAAACAAAAVVSSADGATAATACGLAPSIAAEIFVRDTCAIAQDTTITSQGDLRIFPFGPRIPSVTIEDGVTLSSRGQIQNFGEFINEGGYKGRGDVRNGGVIRNEGSFDVSEQGNFLTGGGAVENLSGGVFINNGAFTLGSGASFTNEGVFENRGAVDIAGFFENSGELIGSAPVTISDGGELVTDVEAVRADVKLNVDGALTLTDELSPSGSLDVPFHVSLGETGSFDAPELVSIIDFGFLALNNKVEFSRISLVGGTLGGANDISRPVGQLENLFDLDSMLSPGVDENRIGTLFFDRIFGTDGLTIDIDIFGAAFLSGANDQVFAGEISQTDSVRVNFRFGDGFAPNPGDIFTFFRLGELEDIDFQFAILGLSMEQRKGLDFRIGNVRDGDDVNNYFLEVLAAPDIGTGADPGTPTPIPLPAGAWLTLSALGLLGVVARRRQPSASAASSA